MLMCKKSQTHQSRRSPSGTFVYSTRSSFKVVQLMHYVSMRVPREARLSTSCHDLPGILHLATSQPCDSTWSLLEGYSEVHAKKPHVQVLTFQLLAQENSSSVPPRPLPVRSILFWPPARVDLTLAVVRRWGDGLLRKLLPLPFYHPSWSLKSPFQESRCRWSLKTTNDDEVNTPFVFKNQNMPSQCKKYAANLYCVLRCHF